jgi:hypothetical protein
LQPTPKRHAKHVSSGYLFKRAYRSQRKHVYTSRTALGKLLLSVDPGDADVHLTASG